MAVFGHVGDALYIGLRLQILLPRREVVLYREQMPQEYRGGDGHLFPWFLNHLQSEGFCFHWASASDNLDELLCVLVSRGDTRAVTARPRKRALLQSF